MHRGTLFLGEVGAQRHRGADVVLRVLCQHGNVVLAQARVGGQRPTHLRVPVPDQLRLQLRREEAPFERPPPVGQGGENLTRHGYADVVGEQRSRSNRVGGVGQQPLPQRRSEVLPPGTGRRPHPGIGVGREAREVLCGDPREFGGLRAGRSGEEVVVQVLGELGAPDEGVLRPEHAPAR